MYSEENIAKYVIRILKLEYQNIAFLFTSNFQTKEIIQYFEKPYIVGTVDSNYGHSLG